MPKAAAKYRFVLITVVALCSGSIAGAQANQGSNATRLHVPAPNVDGCEETRAKLFAPNVKPLPIEQPNRAIVEVKATGKSLDETRFWMKQGQIVAVDRVAFRCQGQRQSRLPRPRISRDQDNLVVTGKAPSEHRVATAAKNKIGLSTVILCLHPCHHWMLPNAHHPGPTILPGIVFPGWTTLTTRGRVVTSGD